MLLPDVLASDTICAVATGGGAIGVIRVSGPAAESILARLAPALAAADGGVALPSHHLRHVRLRHPASGAELDEALVVVMRAPRSYTGDTVIELQAHGGDANLARLLGAVVEAGARPARPGEFTQRAFLAGRIDLARAEAVAEVIAARSQRALRVAQAHLRGAVSTAVEALRARAVALLAEVEAGVDFPDERLDLAPVAALAGEAEALGREAERLAATHDRGRLLVDGVDVALVGRANAGKSSLLNALAGEERALVDAVAGTTRDFLEVELRVGDQRVVLVDTAGERGPADAGADALEERGLELGRRRRARADVVVIVVDGTAGAGEVELALLDEARRLGATPLVAWNKADLAPPPGAAPKGLEGVRIFATSALSGLGVADLGAELVRATGDEARDVREEGVLVTSARQHALLREVAAAAEAAAVALRSGPDGGAELAAVDLRIALERLGQITGESFDAAVLDRIFSRFCIGK